MTVSKVVGSSLDEVWGNYDVAPSSKNSVPRPKKHKVDNIMDNYYEKSKWSRTQQPQSDADQSDGPRDELDRYVSLKNRSGENTEHYMENPRGDAAVLVEPTKEIRGDVDRESMYLDLSLYVFSGIILIFIMEQFINIGVSLRT
jgi:hypothetical protein